ncbi:hypothetical protein [Vacuolonema iberomarrocanum]|uniref:hypothetical protein n=1 Tax=Vacuolonema iberomarrocanum TaxID=3454632 RepID=UPI0019EB5734|nr:hypothetical protein [filamentous cyanobacterium LEGE 07170]
MSDSLKKLGHHLATSETSLALFSGSDSLANLDGARRVSSPSMPLWVERLKRGMAIA